MILRRVALEHYGCFGSAEFEFRRGMNLISGANESGKSLLLAAISAGLFGVEHGSRLRSWGDSLSCKVTLQFEGPSGGLRLSRDLENHLVRLQECGPDGTWREAFAGVAPPAGDGAERNRYLTILEKQLSVGGEALLRVLLDPGYAESIFTDDGKLVAALVSDVTGDAAAAATATSVTAADPAKRQAEIAALEAELVSDRDDYRKGEEYLAWIRKRWEQEGKNAAPAAKKKAVKPASRDQAALERRRDEVQSELKKLGLPARLPADLPALFDKAEGLRQELAALQVELTPLQRRRQGVRMPAVVWPVLCTLAGIAAAGGAFWLKSPWLLPLAAGCGAVLLLAWGIFLVRFNRARAERDGLDQELRQVEQKRADALARQAALAEQFESYGLSSTPVEMVKLQQVYRRNEELVRRYREISVQLGTAAGTLPGAEGGTSADDRHLRPEDLPDAEARLAQLGESLRRREARLAELRDGTAPLREGGSTLPATPSTWTEQQLLDCIAQQMERLTGGRRYDVRLRDGRLQLEVAQGKWAVPASCSRGTVEGLALATRLALCRMTSGLLPLAVDDLPAHLDAKRRRAVPQLLERHAVDHQLLLASNDEELAKRASREHWHVVSLNLTMTEKPITGEEQADAGQLHLL